MPKAHKEGFGQELGATVSPLAYQRTDGDSVNSLHDCGPEATSYEPPADPLDLSKREGKKS